MKQSKTTMKELTARYRAVLIKCALLNLAAFAVAMPAKAADLVIKNGNNITIDKMETYDSVDMTGGHLTIKGTNEDYSVNGGLWSSSDKDMTFKDGTVDFTKRIHGGTDHIRHSGNGSINISGGTFNGHNDNEFVHIGDGDINISNGTFNEVSFVKPIYDDNGVYGYGGSNIPKGKIEISGGVFNNAELGSENSDGISVTGGTFNDTSLGAENGVLNVKDGLFKDSYLEGKNFNISGGTFNEKAGLGGDNITIAGGDFSGVTYLSLDAGDVSIDSDKANFVLSAHRLAHTIETAEFEVTGDKGISIAKTQLFSPKISGKGQITANNDVFIGAFGGSLDKWKNLYSVWDSVAEDTQFSGANITLNGNAKAGTGNILWSSNSFEGAGDDNMNVTLALNNGIKLSDAEIDASVKYILEDLKRVDNDTKDTDDLQIFVSDALEVPYETGETLETIEQAWDSNEQLDYDKIEQALRNAYANYNASVGTDSAQVNIADSTITMNGTSGLVNGTAKDGNIVVSDGSTVTAKGTNEITAKSGTVSFDGSTLVVSDKANLTVATKDGNTLNLTNSTVDLSGTLNGNLNGGTLAFNSANARLNGTISGTGVNINTNLSLSALPSSGLTTLKIADGKTLDIGSGTLKADSITGGTISAVLTDAAKTSAIITAKAEKVTLKLDMSAASRDAVTKYKITDGTGFTFGDYASNRYAVSGSIFDIADAKTIGSLTGWNGGDLWILRLATASEAAIEDLEAAGVKLPENEKNASKILDLANDVLDKLTDTARQNIEKVNDLLDSAAGNAEQVKQILREIAPDASASGAKTASNTAKSVINVINSRFGGSARKGRSGGDYTVGQTSVWAQGMMNYAKLDTDNGFSAHSNGFAAGFEANFTDSFKAGVGYAYTSTDISTERSKTDVKTHTGFVYGEYKPNKAYVNGIVSFGRSDYDDKTRGLSLSSDYKTDTIAAQVAAGYKAGVLTPEAAVRFTNVKQKAYTDAMGAKMAKKTSDTWTGVLGAKVGKDYTLKANRKIGLSPELKVAATYDFARDDENRTVVLPDGSSYTATGEAMKRFGVEAGAGLTVNVGNATEIALTYDGKFKKDYQDHTGMVNLKIKF